tara:strand:+ start:960 stop:1136 length:177 start_codon:yes stop_codon:yes gene_type:complete
MKNADLTTTELTKREYFAIKLMAAYESDDEMSRSNSAYRNAELAVEGADKLLKALEEA